MKSPRQAFRPALLGATAAARAALAEQVYASADVKAALAATAAKGAASGVVITPRAVDLRHTPAAERLIAWLRKEGLQVDWQRRPDPERTSSYGDDYWDLVVSWDGPAGG